MKNYVWFWIRLNVKSCSHKNPECANSFHKNLPNKILNRFFELNSVEIRCSLNLKAQVEKKAQFNSSDPEPYFPEFLNCGLCKHSRVIDFYLCYLYFKLRYIEYFCIHFYYKLYDHKQIQNWNIVLGKNDHIDFFILFYCTNSNRAIHKILQIYNKIANS